MTHDEFHERLARLCTQEAKALTLLAFRNGPIESMHAGKRCEACGGDDSYSQLTDAQMKILNKYMVDRLYELLTLKATDPQEYVQRIVEALEYTVGWDDPAGF